MIVSLPGIFRQKSILLTQSAAYPLRNHASSANMHNLRHPTLKMWKLNPHRVTLCFFTASFKRNSSRVKSLISGMFLSLLFDPCDSVHLAHLTWVYRIGMSRILNTTCSVLLNDTCSNSGLYDILHFSFPLNNKCGLNRDKYAHVKGRCVLISTYWSVYFFPPVCFQATFIALFFPPVLLRCVHTVLVRRSCPLESVSCCECATPKFKGLAVMFYS